MGNSQNIYYIALGTEWWLVLINTNLGGLFRGSFWGGREGG